MCTAITQLATTAASSEMDAQIAAECSRESSTRVTGRERTTSDNLL